MACRQKARASDRSPSCTLFQAEPFSALARTSIMCRSLGALSDSRSASPMTARASAYRPWNSSVCEKITSVRASPRSSPSVGERGLRRGQALVRLVERRRPTWRTSRARAARAPARTGRRTAAPPQARAGAAACRRASARTRCGRSTARRAAATRARRTRSAPRASVTLSSTWYSASSQASADALPPNVSGVTPLAQRVEADQLAPGVEHPVRVVRGVQVVVEHPPRGVRDLPRPASPLLGRVGAQQVVERVPPGHDLHEQRRPGQVAQRDPGLRRPARRPATPRRPR